MLPDESWIGTGPDVIPPAAVYELQKLCDAVPSFPTEDALALVETIGALIRYEYSL